MTTATPARPIDIEPTDTTRSTVSHDAIENLSHEDRAFAPSPEFAAQANATAALYDEAAEDRIAFWEKQARELQWETPWHTTLDWTNAPFARWFDGGKLNVAVNCVDRHVAAGHGESDPDRRILRLLGARGSHVAAEPRPGVDRRVPAR